MSSRIQGRENEEFLEFFRYTIIASNLLGDQVGVKQEPIPALRRTQSWEELQSVQSQKWSLEGVVIVTTVPAMTLLALRWSVRGTTWWGMLLRWIVALFVMAAAIAVGLAHVRRQQQKLLRRKAVETANAVITNLQALDASSSAAIMLIQEVEAVSRGFRL